MYTVDKVVMVKLRNNHIPYYGYCIVTGPMGGRYLLDQFNTEYMLKKAFEDKLAYVSIGIFTRYARDNKILEFTNKNVGDNTISKFAKTEKATLLKRKAGMNKAQAIGKDVDIKSKIKVTSCY